MKKKHIINKREKEYGYGDCYLYKIFCSCGKECGGWTPQEAEDDFRKHFEVTGNSSQS